MKNIIIYILGLGLFLILSCDTFDEVISGLDENEVELEYNYYIQEGWNSIQSQEFDDAITFFDYIISNEKIESLGWKPKYSLDDGSKELIKGYKIIINNDSSHFRNSFPLGYSKSW